MSEWISSISHAQVLDSLDGMGIVPKAGCSMLQSDHVIAYRRMGEQYWEVAPMLHRSADACDDVPTSPRPQQVGRGMVGYAAMVGKDVRVADAKASSLYDVRGEDVILMPLAHSVNPVAIVHAKHADQAEAGVMVKAMRGCKLKAEPYSQDDMALLRLLACSTQQVWSAPCLYCLVVQFLHMNPFTWMSPMTRVASTLHWVMHV